MIRCPEIDPRPGDVLKGRSVDNVQLSYHRDQYGDVIAMSVYIYRVRYKTPGSKRGRWVTIDAWRRWAGVAIVWKR